MRRVIDAVLYEGHVLWPYRRSALKNHERWTFGRLHPEAHRAAGDACALQAQTLLELDGAARVTITLRFLQLIERDVYREGPGGPEPVDSIEIDGHQYLAWDEATEREVAMTMPAPAQLTRQETFEIPAGREEETLHDANGTPRGALVRSWRALRGVIEATAEPVESGLARVTVRVKNTTPWPTPAPRVLGATLLATHVVLQATAGRWVSLTDAPPAWQAAASLCVNVRTWPVLVGEPGDRSTVLAAPIVLYDYPQIAPESPGDFFDASEIDQLLVLNVLGLTDEERREMAASDPRAREILERCAGLSAEDFMRLHGALRDPRGRAGG